MNAGALSGLADHDHDHAPYIEDYFLAEAVAVSRLTPSMIRVVLRVAGGERWVSSGHPDEWVRLAFGPDARTPVTLPVLMPDGRWGRPDGSRPCPNRPYTVRHWDAAACEMVVDLVLHEGGVAAGWAARVRVGDVVGLCNPEGRFWLPPASCWVVMLADITGLPAVGRVLKELPAGFRAIVHIEVPCAEDRQTIATHADLTLSWHICHGLKPERAGYTELPRIAQTITQLPAGLGYVFIAGEAKAAAAARCHFRDTLGQPKSRIDAVGYWIEGQARV